MTNSTGSARWYRARLLEALVKLYGGDCCRCHEPVDITLPGYVPLGPTIDHLIAWSGGKDDSLENLRLAHFRCNSRHGSSLVGKAAARRMKTSRRASPGEGQASLW